MARHKFSKEEQSKGGKVQARPKKNVEWEALRDDIIGRHTERFNSLLDQLDDEEFAKQYLNVLNYFKPKLTSAQVQGAADITITIKEPDWDAD